MKVEVTKLPESRVALKIELTPEEADQALDRTYKRLVQRVTVPGFRKGKAPRHVVERAVGHEFFLHEATDDAVRWGYRKAIDQEKVNPIDEADVSTGEDGEHHLEPGQPFSFEATVPVRPEIELPDYHALKVERQSIDVTDKDVEELLEEIRTRNAILEPTIRSADIGDVVTMNVTARVDGQETVNEENAEFELRAEEDEGPRTVFPGLSKELIGVNRGDIREIALPLPDSYPNAEQAGKTMMVRALIKEIKAKVLPAIDDDLAQTVGNFETLNDLREALRSNLELERTRESDERIAAEAIEQLTSRTFVEIPPVLIEEELDHMVDEMRDAFEQRQLNFELYLETSKKSQADLRGEMREDAIRNVKTTLVLGALADAEDVDVSNEEVNAVLEDLLRSGSLSDTDRRRIGTSSSVRSRIRSRLRRQRAIQRLVSVMTGGDEVSEETAEMVADEASEATGERPESMPVEVGG